MRDHWRQTYELLKAHVRSLTNRLERYFVLCGGIALILGLSINTPWWPYRVRAVNHDPIVFVDWGLFIAKLNERAPRGEWQEALSLYHLPSSAENLGYVMYTLEWYSDWEKSIEYWRRVRRLGGREYSREEMNQQMTSGRVKAAKEVYGYQDADMRRQTFGKSFNPLASDQMAARLVESPAMLVSLAMMNEMPSGSGAGTTFLADVFYRMGETISDRIQKAHYYEALRESSVFFTPFEVRNDGFIPAANVKTVSSMLDQELIKETMESGSIAATERIGSLQTLSFSLVPPGASRTVLFKSRKRPLPGGEFHLVNPPLVAEVANYWFFIFLPPLLALIF